MGSLLRFFSRNHVLLLFLALEFISLILVFNFNNYQQVKYLNSANRITGSIYGKISEISDYFYLTKINRKLAEENAKLKTEIHSEKANLKDRSFLFNSTEMPGINYKYVSARVVHNSINKPYNYITLNKGRKDGIKTDQGIVSSSGVVGVVAFVSDSYSLGLSVLNPRWDISAKLKNSGNFGPLSWDGSDYRYANLREIPSHIQVSEGDSVITSGYSTIFPEGVLIGIVSAFSRPEGENSYSIKVKLNTDFVNLNYVDVIENVDREEIKLLEGRAGTDDKIIK